MNFKNMDKMMLYMDAHPELGIHLFYSTPRQYLFAVQSLNLSWSLKVFVFFLEEENKKVYFILSFFFFFLLHF